MICLYHSVDFDGSCSGATVKTAHPDCVLYQINYGDEFPWELIKGETVAVVNFGLQPFDNMLRLKDESSNLIWIALSQPLPGISRS